MLNLKGKESVDILKGTTREVYRLFLITDSSLGIREIQRTLKLSSPSQAQYHINKLEEAGFLKREQGNYVLDKVFLENHLRISHFLIPRYLFYSIFASAILLFELTFFRPTEINREYFFFVSATLLFVAIFYYETIKVWRNGTL
ncbi:MAG: hypothetical protein CW716_11305 [Candidatus Bathyarchaeum sp.]|nr:MAG: hypothetical protein CW716_11305 [Candidatus Bathyarchaeum sp.]